MYLIIYFCQSKVFLTVRFIVLCCGKKNYIHTNRKKVKLEKQFLKKLFRKYSLSPNLVYGLDLIQLHYNTTLSNFNSIIFL